RLSLISDLLQDWQSPCTIESGFRRAIRQKLLAYLELLQLKYKAPSSRMLRHACCFHLVLVRRHAIPEHHNSHFERRLTVALTRWEPFMPAEWNRLHDEMSQLFDRLSAISTGRGLAVSYPPVNIWQDDDNIFVEAEL